MCETLWGVECFLDEASDEEINTFADACRKGKIGLSASYLNMTELINEDVMLHCHKWILERLEGYGVALPKYAVTSDVNGLHGDMPTYLRRLVQRVG